MIMENRLRVFQERLSALEGGLEQLLADKNRLEAETQALRQHMTVVCLATVLDLARGALAKAEESASSDFERGRLREIAQQLGQTEQSSESNCMAAYDHLRKLHLACQRCVAPKTSCPWGPPCSSSGTSWCSR